MTTAGVLPEWLVRRAVGLVTEGRALLGVTGCPGAGKTCVAEALAAAACQALGRDAVAHVPMDGFHLADRQLDRLGLRARKGAPETFDAAGYVALLRRLREQTSGGHETDDVVYAPAFERDLEQPLAGAVAVSRAVRLVVTEGNYLLLDGPWRPVRDVLDETWFVDVDDEQRVRRLVARHELFGKSHEEAVAWVAGVDEPNAVLVRASRDRADLVVSG